MAISALWLVVAGAHASAASVASAASASSAAAGTSPASTVPKVPGSFVGVNIDGPLAGGQPSLPPAMSTMVGAGVESIRVAFNWAAAQPTENGPYDFSATDLIVGSTRRAGTPARTRPERSRSRVRTRPTPPI
jgi:hypothetical protein